MDNKERFIEIFTSQIHRPGAAELLEWLESTDFFEAPASTHYHGSYPGGLVEHMLQLHTPMRTRRKTALMKTTGLQHRGMQLPTKKTSSFLTRLERWNIKRRSL